MGHARQTWLNIEASPSAKRSRFLRLTAEKLIEKGGTSAHSALGLTLKLTLARLEEAGCPYTLTAFPGQGYMIEVLEPAKRDLTTQE